MNIKGYHLSLSTPFSYLPVHVFFFNSLFFYKKKMSADHGLLQDLSQTKLPKLKIQSSYQTGNENTNPDDSSSSSKECCVTPTSKEHKIPAVLSCPGAPKKPRKTYVSCKRKLLSKFQFFDIINREEVDAFFNTGFDHSISKRRCSPT
ncbi:hypothetical protein CXB51_001284 [Gossypium anomalum]|uniref:Cyclin-dependent protein kinase inhibitor SMR1 n=1 Tax=Gossypium anomalum TaxID=47600 RepID=A0A8J5ZAK0_9ROSI|nr:hypothetical protein CXB51_001284 [Gossypium anomalum]